MLKVGMIVVVAIIDIAVGPGGGFGGPGGGVGKNRTSGTPLLLHKPKNHPQDWLVYLLLPGTREKLQGVFFEIFNLFVR